MVKGIVHKFLCILLLRVTVASPDKSIALKSYSDKSEFNQILPTNSNSSVQYLLYTPENPTNACYIEPEASVFDKCVFNSSLKTKFIIHGYLIKLLPGNLFVKIKDTLLEYNKYNVILVNWTKYNQQDYTRAMLNAFLVGGDLAAMIHFLTSHANVSATSIHLIGHSLGAQVAGVAGKNVTNLGRITGLDPAGPGYFKEIKRNRLASTDAELVDVIHTSNSNTGYGYGTYYLMGRINFYPNGGELQPMCAFGETYSDGDGEQHKILLPSDQSACFHDSAIQYFISSILVCQYKSTQCTNYASYERGQCKSKQNVTDLMGFHCKAIPALQDHSKFFLDTSGNSPFC